jgi:hypothetical protein
VAPDYVNAEILNLNEVVLCTLLKLNLETSMVMDSEVNEIICSTNSSVNYLLCCIDV